MSKRQWVYPFDVGGGPHNVSCLPAHVDGLGNDAYRSLAWYVRNRFGYFKDPTNPIFAEFKWANFFRTRVLVDDELLDPESGVDITDVRLSSLGEADLDEVIGYALALAVSPAASKMPGYRGGT